MITIHSSMNSICDFAINKNHKYIHITQVLQHLKFLNSPTRNYNSVLDLPLDLLFMC